jgi:hypothetical protein
MVLKRVRWAVLACYVVAVRTCSLFRITLPMNSFFAHTISETSGPTMSPRVSLSNYASRPGTEFTCYRDSC